MELVIINGAARRLPAPRTREPDRIVGPTTRDYRPLGGVLIPPPPPPTIPPWSSTSSPPGVRRGRLC